MQKILFGEGRIQSSITELSRLGSEIPAVL
jgi:hypothetical protein